MIGPADRPTLQQQSARCRRLPGWTTTSRLPRVFGSLLIGLSEHASLPAADPSGSLFAPTQGGGGVAAGRGRCSIPRLRPQEMRTELAVLETVQIRAQSTLNQTAHVELAADHQSSTER